MKNYNLEQMPQTSGKDGTTQKPTLTLQTNSHDSLNTENSSFFVLIIVCAIILILVARL